MAKFNFDNANQKNVFSGEDGILFIHENEKGERCIEVNSENFIYCVKTHLGEVFNDLDIKKLWLRFITPHGKLIFNLDDLVFIINKLVIPFTTMDEKKKFDDLMEELYDQIITIEKGEYLWKILEARCNEGLWDGLKECKGESDYEKFGDFLAKRFEGMKETDYATFLKDLYLELMPETMKCVSELSESGNLIDVFKPIANIMSLGLVYELINNTNFINTVSKFFTGNLNTFSMFKSLLKNKPKKKFETCENVGAYTSGFKFSETFAKSFTQNEEEKPKSNIDYKFIKNKFVKEIDSILDMASDLSKEEFIIKLHQYKENFEKLFDLYQAKQELDNEIEKLK